MANQSDLQQQFSALPIESQPQETSEYTLLHYLLRLLEVLEGRGDTLSASDRSKVDKIRTIVEDDGYIGDDRDLHVAGFMTFIATQSCTEIVRGSWEEYMSSEIGARIQTIVEARR
ncbi:hypothetical protein RU639_003412 [Aspergillus parasiticus]|uniref:Uncharacterized protein n=1 Tax=Aspergillus novoparasiticus TaxID=986946 RepID=A0A5N6FAY3_9EURO|nr:hypothetical protein BDV33DRAFT_162831 [Aspergillus novoparasiticus]